MADAEADGTEFRSNELSKLGRIASIAALTGVLAVYCAGCFYMCKKIEKGANKAIAEIFNYRAP
jgi:hypothetical protein